jgi:hypothetical protein
MMRPVGVKTRLFRVSVSDGLEKAWSISRPIFSVPPLSGVHESCLVDDSRVGRFVPESAKPRISSESDSAALAPLQCYCQDLSELAGDAATILATEAKFGQQTQASVRTREAGPAMQGTEEPRRFSPGPSRLRDRRPVGCDGTARTLLREVARGWVTEEPTAPSTRAKDTS